MCPGTQAGSLGGPAGGRGSPFAPPLYIPLLVLLGCPHLPTEVAQGSEGACGLTRGAQWLRPGCYTGDPPDSDPHGRLPLS